MPFFGLNAAKKAEKSLLKLSCKLSKLLKKLRLVVVVLVVVSFFS